MSKKASAGYAPRYQGMLHTLARSDKFRLFAPLLRCANGSPSSRWQRLCERANLTRDAEAISLRIEGLPGPHSSVSFFMISASRDEQPEGIP